MRPLSHVMAMLVRLCLLSHNGNRTDAVVALVRLVMEYALRPDHVKSTERALFLSDPPCADLHIAHSSRSLKLWARFLDNDAIGTVDLTLACAAR